MTVARQAEIAINPSAYQRTHKLAMAAHSAALRIGEQAIKTEQELAELRKDNSDLWGRVNLATIRNDKMAEIVADYQQRLQNMQTLAAISVCAGLLSLAFSFGALFIR